MNVPFGTQKNSSIFFEKVLDEIEAFFTGDEKYKDSRLAILKESGFVQKYIVGGISIALAPVLGTSASFLAPVVAIVLLIIGKMGLNAWIATRREKKENKPKE
jgi:Mg2+/citrate symporter